MPVLIAEDGLFFLSDINGSYIRYLQKCYCAHKNGTCVYSRSCKAKEMLSGEDDKGKKQFLSNVKTKESFEAYNKYINPNTHF